jgi:two-component system chemotaxis response regulator CheY
MKSGLTVDDSAVVRKVIVKMLKELNLETREAENGQKALEECTKQKPDFILLDWNMPVMNGLEFIKHFRNDKANDDVVVIFCTTENELSKINEALAQGSNEYIMKPFDAQVLKDKLIQTGIL